MTVHFIGAGPGAPDLITLRGYSLIRSCPVCLYAGSLVPREIIAAVILGCRAYPTIDVHLRRALAEGATLREAARVLRLHGAAEVGLAVVARAQRDDRRILLGTGSMV